MMFLNKDTKLYGSFSEKPTNNGCEFFNNAFKKFNLNSIYKSFYSDNLELTLTSVKHLRFSGFAVSRPFKIKIMEYLDFINDDCLQIGSCNTILIEDNKLLGFNTDWIGVYNFLKNKNIERLNIIGFGGFGKSVSFACDKLGIETSIILRNDINNLKYNKNEHYFNCTPINIDGIDNNDNSNIFSSNPLTDIGKQISILQAVEQFKIYTGINYE